MSSKKLMCITAVAISCSSGWANAQLRFDRIDPNVWHLPRSEARPTPPAPPAVAAADNRVRPDDATPEDRSGPNIIGEPAGLTFQGAGSGRPVDAMPGCERCVAI